MLFESLFPLEIQLLSPWYLISSFCWLQLTACSHINSEFFEHHSTLMSESHSEEEAECDGIGFLSSDCTVAGGVGATYPNPLRVLS